MGGLPGVENLQPGVLKSDQGLGRPQQRGITNKGAAWSGSRAWSHPFGVESNLLVDSDFSTEWEGGPFLDRMREQSPDLASWALREASQLQYWGAELEESERFVP